MDTDRTLAGLVLTSLPLNQTFFDSMTFMHIENGSSSQFDHIDQEILRYENAVRELKSQRNLLAPISKLPAEILCNIFMFCSMPDPVTPSTYAPDVRWRWITVTHITRLWRTIAESCPALWSKPEFTKTEWAYEMIKRSKMAPLTIEVNSNYWLTPRVVDAVGEGLKHLSRINEIHLSASRDNMDKLLSGINRPAPFLRTLFLDIGRSDYYYHSRAEPYILPEDFLGGDAARLSHIELSRCHLHWDSSLLRNLTYLKVHNPGPPGPTLDQFVNALAGMSQLEVLDLENTLPANADTDSPEKPHVSLPNLRKLRAVGNLIECSILLEHVYIPSSTVIQIIAKCSEPPEIGSVTLGLINQVCQRLPVTRDSANATARSGTSVPVIKSLLVQSTGMGSGVVVEAWNNVPSSKNKTPCAIIPASHESALTLNSFTSATSVGILKLEFTWQNAVMKQLHNEVVVAICLPLPLTQLRNLHIRNGYHKSVNSPTFAKTFGSLPKVSSLTVEGNSAYEFVDALNQVHYGGHSSSSPDAMCMSPSPSPSPARTTVAFPALRTLKLLEADFDRDREEANTLLQPLMDCLMYRSELKYEIHKLILERCTHLILAEVDRLEEIVADVEWDSLEYGYSDTEDDDMDEDYDEGMDIIGGGESYYGYGAAYVSSDEDMMFMGMASGF